MRVRLENTGNVVALASKLTLVDGRGERILPAYYDDNYLSLLPGETRELTIVHPERTGPASIQLRGWNLSTVAVRVFPEH